MKLTPDNPSLTAFVLGELNESDTAATAKLLASDPDLAKEGDRISAMAGLLSDTLSAENLSLGDSRHQEIFKSGYRPDAKVLVLDHKKRSRRQSFLAVAGVAAVVVTGFIVLSQFGVDGPGAGTNGSDFAGSGASLAEGKPGDGVTMPSDDSSVTLPMNLGFAVPAMVEESLTRNDTLPDADQFDVASWVNLTQHTKQPEVIVGGIEVYTELGSCPWNSGKSLLMVNLRSGDDVKVPVLAELNLDPARVKSAQLVGGNESGAVIPASGGELEGSRTWLYELELVLGDEKIGVLNLDVSRVDGAHSGHLPLATDPSLNRDVSTDFAVARTLAGFAKWGSSKERNFEQLEEIANAARQLLVEVKDGKIRYALDAVLLAEEHFAKED